MLVPALCCQVLKASGKAEVPSYQEARKLVAAPKPSDKKKTEEKKKAAPAKKEEKKAAPKKGSSSSSPTFKLDGKVGSGTQVRGKGNGGRGGALCTVRWAA